LYVLGQTTQNPNPPHPLALLLHPRRERPRDRRAAEKGDEVAASHVEDGAPQTSLL
jgi:hypothetical protein